MKFKFISILCLLLTGCHPSKPEVTSSELYLLESSFEESRKVFKELSSEMKLKNSQTVIGSQEFSYSKDGEKFSIDYLYLPPKTKSQNLLILNAGIHGVEAPAGIFLQHQFLNECLAQAETPILERQMGILLLHGINPYGALHGRRANGNNVDLNRNFFEVSQDKKAPFPGLAIENQDYKDLQNALENRISQWELIKLIVMKGKEKGIRAVRGQYHSPKGVFYGGQELQPESKIVQELVSTYAKGFKNVMFVDFHTGLGKYGINQIMVSPHADLSKPEMAKAYEKELSVLKRLFPEEECKDVCELQIAQTEFADMESTQKSGAHSYMATGDTTHWVHTHDLEKRISGVFLSVAAEIGTKTGRKVLEGVIDENYCFFHRDECSENRYIKEVERMRRLFNPNDAKWKSQVIRSGRQMCGAFKRFSEL